MTEKNDNAEKHRIMEKFAEEIGLPENFRGIVSGVKDGYVVTMLRPADLSKYDIIALMLPIVMSDEELLEAFAQVLVAMLAPKKALEEWLANVKGVEV